MTHINVILWFSQFLLFLTGNTVTYSHFVVLAWSV